MKSPKLPFCFPAIEEIGLLPKTYGYVPTRYGIALMLFSSSLINYMMRVNMSLNIIAMVPSTDSQTNAQSECLSLGAISNNTETRSPAQLWKQPDGTTFSWTAQQQAYILSAYFWSYAGSNLVGGPAVERWGPRKVVVVTTLVCSLMTLLSPWAARVHYWALFAVRFTCGVVSGFLFPALHALIAHWAPPAEKGMFVSSTQGGLIGIVVTWSVSGPLLENWGWEVAFYVEGAVGILWCVWWYFMVYDSPTQHPRISEDEMLYISEQIGDKVHSSNDKIAAPFKKILTSFPFLAMVILHFGSNWGLNLFTISAPKFVSSVLGFDLGSTGTLASLPYLARVIFSFIFGVIGDRIIKTKKLSTTFLRKVFCLFSHVLPGVLLLALGYAGCSPTLSVALMTFSMGLNGAATLTSLVVLQDLAPNFAGTLYGISNGIGNTPGFLTPLVTAYFTRYGNGFTEWRLVFMTGAIAYIASAVYFVIFGTGETQEWNHVTPVEKDRGNTASNTDNTEISIKL